MIKTLQWALDNHHRLTLCGILDYTTVASLWQQRQQLFRGEQLIIDLGAITRVDSAGLALLIQLTELASQQKIACQLIGVTHQLRSLIEIYNLLPIVMPYLEPINPVIEQHDNG
jgi:phospholipid transport system transporter-binding protein